MKTRRILVLAAILAAFGSASRSQTRPPRLLADILPGKGKAFSSEPYGKSSSLMGFLKDSFVTLGGVFYFFARDCRHGVELRSGLPFPGTARLVVDLAPGMEDSTGIAPQLIAFKGRLYYYGGSSILGWGVVRSDGTPRGTYLLWKQPYGYGGSFSAPFAAGERLYFFRKASFGSLVNDLYAYDGVSASPVRLAGGFSGVWKNPVSAGGKVFFAGSFPQGKNGLWVTDGTPAGTREIHALDPYPTWPLVASGKWVYFIYRGIQWSGIMKTDGTRVLRVVSIGLPSGWWDPIVLGGKIIFGGPGASGGKGDPWVLDTATGKVSFLKSISPPWGQGYVGSVRLGKRVLFCANETTQADWALWSTDGTGAGTFKVASLWKGSGSWGKPVVSGNRVFFIGYDPKGGWELWVTDGTGAGTRRVLDIYPGTRSSNPASLTPLGGGRIAFAATTPTEGREPWISDGTPGGTFLLEDIWKGRSAPGSSPDLPAPFMGRLFFSAADPKHGRDLWVSGGTPGGTRSFKAYIPGVPTGTPMNSVSLGARILYTMYTSGPKTRFFSTDGSPLGTRSFLVPCRVWRGFPAATEKWAFFLGADSAHGYEPWVSDGTPGGTRLLKELVPGNRGVAVTWALRWKDRVAFGAKKGKRKEEVWVTDGTTAGTRPLAQGMAGTGWPAVLGDKLFFLGEKAGSTHGGEPWVSDGTMAGTRELLDLAPGSNSGGFTAPVSLEGKIIFFGDDGRTVSSGKAGLFRTDGTAQGTKRVGRVEFSKNSILWSRALNRKRCIFWADDGVHGKEPWVTDGTAFGTYMLADLVPGPDGSEPVQFVRVGSRRGAVLYGAGSKRNLGILVTDGTREGTRRIGWEQFCPGGKLGDFLGFAGGTLYFSADDGFHGLEPWAWAAGATVERIGWSTGAPFLEGEDPVLGTGIRLTLGGLGPGKAGILFFGRLPAAPLLLGKGAGLFVDPARRPFWASLPGKGGVLTLAVPSDPVLSGLRLAVQAAAGPSARVVDFTNGLLLSFGY